MSDPAQSSIVYLANWDGVDGQTIYWHEIGPERAIFSGNAQLESSVTVFGNTTAYVDGTGDYITWGVATDCQFLHDKTTDYTIDLWFRRATLAADGILLSSRDSNCGIELKVLTTGAVVYSIYGDSGLMTSATTAAGVITAAEVLFIQVAYSMAGGIAIYVEGVQEATGSPGTVGTPVDTNEPLTFGRSAGGSTGQCEANFGPVRICTELNASVDVPEDVFPFTPLNYDPSADYLLRLANFIAPDGTTTDYRMEVGGDFLGWGGGQIDSNSLLLDGVNDYVSVITSTAALYMHNGLSSWTLEAVINADTQHTGYIASSIGTFAHGVAVWVHPGTTALRVTARVQDSFGNAEAEIVSADDTVPVGADVYIVVTYELLVGMKLFIDGIEAGTAGVFPSPHTSAGNNFLLGANNGANFFDGRIKNFRLYKNFAKYYGDVVGNPVLPFPGFPLSFVTAPYFLSDFRAHGNTDFTDLVSSSRENYTMQLSGVPAYPVPISVWQATLQLGSAIYAQCFIPDVTDYRAEIEARIAAGRMFIVYRVLQLAGVTAQVAVADALMQTTAITRGDGGYTCLLSGYGELITAPADPVTYQLTGIRSVSTSATGKLRVRANIHWDLKPGDIADTGDQTFTVSRITYYCNQNQSYMDAGEA